MRVSLVLLFLLGTVYAEGPMGASMKPLKLDGHSGAIVNVRFPTERIHSGKAFFCINTITTDTATLDRLVQVPAGCEPHTRWFIECSEDTSAYVYEGVTVSASGTPLSSYNHLRSSTITPAVTTYLSPTVASTGTLIWSQEFGGKKVSGYTESEDEIIFKPNTLYLFRTIATGTYWYSGKLKWCE